MADITPKTSSKSEPPAPPAPKVTIWLQPPNLALAPVEVEYLPNNAECIKMMAQGYSQVHPK